MIHYYSKLFTGVLRRGRRTRASRPSSASSPRSREMIAAARPGRRAGRPGSRRRSRCGSSRRDPSFCPFRGGKMMENACFALKIIFLMRKWIFRNYFLEKLWNKKSIFGRPFIVCIEADFCEQIVVLQYVFSSTLLAHCCNALNLTTRQHSVAKVCIFFVKFRQDLQHNCQRLLNLENWA